MEREIGSSFEYNNKMIEIIESHHPIQCNKCYFYKLKCYITELSQFIGKCSPAARLDKKAISFKEIRDYEETKI